MTRFEYIASHKGHTMIDLNGAEGHLDHILMNIAWGRKRRNRGQAFYPGSENQHRAMDAYEDQIKEELDAILASLARIRTLVRSYKDPKE